MASSVTFPARFLKRIAKLGSAVDDIETELLPTLLRLMDEDNTDGLLAGLDKDSMPLAPLARRTLANPKRGTGPPLAPKYRDSRAIKNYMLAHIKQSRGVYLLVGGWENVLSKTGVPFLPFHFEGRGRLPKRDIRGVRQSGKAAIKQAMIAWLLGK